jgi:hypothetical protein
MKRFGWLVLIVLTATSASNAGSVLTRTKGRAQLKTPATGAIALSDTIVVSLKVEGTSALVVELPPELPADAPWTLIERSAVQREMAGPDRMIMSIRYVFAPRQPGKKIEFKFPNVKYRDGLEIESIAFTPDYYEVTTQINDADTALLRDTTSIEPLPPIDAPGRVWLSVSFLVAAVVLLCGALIAWRIFMRRPKMRSAAEFAMWEWRRLVAMKLPEKGKNERFITLLTTVVRRYLERQFDLPARRKTTPEFVVGLTNAAGFDDEDKAFLVSFLERCETVKFANAAMSAKECGQWSERVRRFLEARVKGQAATNLPVEKNAQSR